MEVWLGVYNELMPQKKVFTTEGNNVLARTSFVKDETQRIIDRIKTAPDSVLVHLEERIRKILKRKVSRFNRIAKKEILYVE